MAHIFLSPHYDDAVYSCGGTIHQLVQNGHDVIIMTTMAGIPTLPLPDTPIIRDNHTRWEIGDTPVAARRREDGAAARILGANTEYIETIPDCIYRTHNNNALYPDEHSLWDDVHPDDPAITTLNNLDVSYADALYAPLGVGGHVDHLIVREWVKEYAKRDDIDVYFYEDYPYMRDKDAIAKALKQFDVTLRSHNILLTEHNMQNKIRAMMAYQSQIKSFWDDADALAHEVQNTFKGASETTFLERYYRYPPK